MLNQADILTGSLTTAPPSASRWTILGVRIRQHDLAQLRRKAAEAGQSMSELVREALGLEPNPSEKLKEERV